MGRSADTEMKGLYMPVRCRWCRKIFIKPDADWKYRLGSNKTRTYYCSYACLKAARRHMADQDRHKVMHVSRSGADITRHMHSRLGIDPGEAHELWEWADIYGINYYELWEKVVEYYMPVDDAICLILAEKEAI